MKQCTSTFTQHGSSTTATRVKRSYPVASSLHKLVFPAFANICITDDFNFPKDFLHFARVQKPLPCHDMGLLLCEIMSRRRTQQ